VQRLRFATLIDDLTIGGAELMARVVALRIDPERFERSIVVTRPGRVDDREELEAAGIKLFELDRRSKADVLQWRHLVSFLRREKIDVIHAHKFGSNVNAVVWGRVARVPVVISHEHTWSYEGGPMRRLLDKHLIGRLSDRVLTESPEDARRMAELEGLDPARIQVVPIAPWSYELHAGKGSERDLRAELGLPEDALVVGTVAVLRPQKALHLLVEAAARLAPDYPSLHVLIAGEGPERAELERLIAEAGLGGRMRILGRFAPAEVPGFLDALDIAVNCSDFEGTPGAVLEAMAAGLPHVATRVGGVPGLVEDGVNGILIERGDAGALEAGLRRLLDDRELRERMGAAGKARQLERYDVRNLVGMLEELYERLYRERTAGR
jgi:glycosyltransferase involved in cell wall biosynthesis